MNSYSERPYLKYMAGLVATILVVAVVLIIVKSTKPESVVISEPKDVHERVSAEEAQRLIEEYLKANNGSLQLPIVEVGGNQIFEYLGCQIFKDREYESYVIRDKELTHIGMGFGGMGVTSVCSADLNKDGQLELVYTYSFGSGLHRSHVAALMFDETSKEIVSDFVYTNKDLLLEKKDYYTILVREHNGSTTVTDNLFGKEIGILSLEGSKDSYKLVVKLKDN
ncbi:hypothetical protein [Clostridium thermarum]|uniref:hypothetical protein n=2 Tax=Clostridium thermarum TaxID=1716543 RepID=UPI0011222FD2|nr:hypothetical protein [Clostridium thermarum]